MYTKLFRANLGYFLIFILNWAIFNFNLLAMGTSKVPTLQSLSSQKVVEHVFNNTYNCDEIHEADFKILSNRWENSWSHNYIKLGHLPQDADLILSQAAKDFILKNYGDKKEQKNLWLQLQSLVQKSYVEYSFDVPPTDLSFSDDSQFLLIETEDGGIYEFNLKDKKPLKIQSGTGRFQDIKNYLQEKNKLNEKEIEIKKKLSKYLDYTIRCMCLTPDNNFAFVASRSAAYFYDIEKEEQVLTYEWWYGVITSVAFSPDNNYFAISIDHEVYVYKTPKKIIEELDWNWSDILRLKKPYCSVWDSCNIV